MGWRTGQPRGHAHPHHHRRGDRTDRDPAADLAQGRAAAGHALVRFAGGTVIDLDGNELVYGKPGFENPHFIAQGPGVTPKA